MAPTDGPDAELLRHGALLTIDLDAIQENYRRLCKKLARAACAAVVKADAYGLGVTQVGPALADAGVRDFFVALPFEGLALREALAGVEPAPRIFILSGFEAGLGPDFQAAGLIPVLNSLGQIAAWREAALAAGSALPAAIHVDSGMSRLGLPPSELDVLAEEPGRLDGLDPLLVMSHLACAEEAENPKNREQLALFEAARARLPALPASFANSSGIFLGAEFHFQLARPGVALYGVNPTPGQTNPMAQVVRLQARILQVREIDAPTTVGYGAAFRAAGPTRIATVAVGYADGYLRSLSNRGTAFLGDNAAPVVGRISMDLITLDVTKVPAENVRPGAPVDLIAPGDGLDRLAEEAGTIGYEILTSLGRRYRRVYLSA
ncbi:MAG: alanine racemase [Kiloniellales bacterium]|nr:alanine racemase [Kiloniellales bacterium]